MNLSEKNINKNGERKRALVAPLDWGLGHATRCIPVIHELLRQGFIVSLAAEKTGAALLQKEFPDLQILPLAGYRISYGKRKTFFFINMFLQVPKILSAIKKERRWLKNTVKEHSINLVVSDNRFGLSCKNAYCIFMTHQLFIKTGNRFTEKIAQKINYRYINRFNECWVPDVPGNENLAGELSHPEKMPLLPVKYVGILSRFKTGIKEKTIDLLALVSGPEPQRTLFENILLQQMKMLNKKMVLIRGLPSAVSKIKKENKNLTIIDHLPGNELNELILSAKAVVARSGYSTVMDLATLQQKAILVPTPGQTEQEYLAQYLSDKKYFIATVQENLNLTNAIKKVEAEDPVIFPAAENNSLKFAVNALK